MTRCSARGCENSGGHLFPKDPKLKKKWMKFVELDSVGKYAVVCKGHFKNEDFCELPPLPGLPTPRKRLKATAVPSIQTKDMKPFEISTKSDILSPRVRTSFKYETTVNTSSFEPVYKPEVLGVSVAVLTESELFQVIETVKNKLVKNAPASAQFPAKWSQPGPVVKTKRIREGYPPFSMACLAAVAVESAPKQIASTAQILAFISKNFPCYKLKHPEWQNKVIETIKLYKLFKKVPAAETPNPKKTYWSFAPNKRTVISPEVYEAFTDPRFDESKIDFSHAVIQTDFEIVSVCSENVVTESLDDLNQDLQLPPEKSLRKQDGRSIGAAGEVHLDEEMPQANSKNEKKAAKIVEMDGLEHERHKRDIAMARLDPSAGNTSDTGTEESEGLDSSTDDDDSSDYENYFLDDYDPSVTLYKCSFCKFTSTNDKITSNHILDKHLSGVVYCCETCNFVSPKTSKLDEHKKSCQGAHASKTSKA
uniref:Forkhead box protein I2 n=1 Tax=Lygus hesperus TaxID=30085 RepID=A0A146LS17_LYGHE